MNIEVGWHFPRPHQRSVFSQIIMSESFHGLQFSPHSYSPLYAQLLRSIVAKALARQLSSVGNSPVVPCLLKSERNG